MLRVAELDGVERVAPGSDHGQVGQGIGTDDLELDIAAVDEGGVAASCPSHHVGRGEQEPIGGEGHGRPAGVAAVTAAPIPNGTIVFANGVITAIGAAGATLCFDFLLFTEVPFPIAFVLGLALWAMRTSVGGQKLLALDD